MNVEKTRKLLGNAEEGAPISFRWKIQNGTSDVFVLCKCSDPSIFEMLAQSYFLAMLSSKAERLYTSTSYRQKGNIKDCSDSFLPVVNLAECRLEQHSHTNPIPSCYLLLMRFRRSYFVSDTDPFSYRYGLVPMSTAHTALILLDWN
jgi:hypothetical protein